MAHHVPTAKRALQSVRHKQKLDAWLVSIGATEFCSYGENILHEYVDDKGYKYVFEAEFAYHIGHGFGRHNGLTYQKIGNTCPPCLTCQKVTCNNKDFAKHDAYLNMIKSTKTAIEQDVECYCKTPIFYISVIVYSPCGEEVYSDGLGGCDYDYVMSGGAFFEHDMFENCQREAQEHFSYVKPQALTENYTQGAYI